MFLSLVRPDRISSPITSTAAVTTPCLEVLVPVNIVASFGDVPLPACGTVEASSHWRSGAEYRARRRTRQITERANKPVEDARNVAIESMVWPGGGDGNAGIPGSRAGHHHQA